MKVALISSVVPGNAGGGSLLLRRHFREAREMEVLVISDGPTPEYNHVAVKHRLSSRVFKRIAKTPMHRWGFDGQELFLPCNPNQVAQICRIFKPDIILTVAHGEFSRLAFREARASRVPLVTIFHDWWPDLVGTHEITKPFLDRRFIALHQNSTASLCVCEGMVAALGARLEAKVLYPIPSRCVPSISQADTHLSGAGMTKVIYMGNLGDYGGMVQAALEATKGHSAIRLEARGGRPAWPTLFTKEMQASGRWNDFLPEEKLGKWLATADAFLVAMRFEPHLRRFMETSFPSKITHYAQFHKPIVIWGPDYCSAVRWARKKDSALCVTDPSPLALVRALETLNSIDHEKWSAKAREAANNEFNLDKIQKQFVEAIHSASKNPLLL